MFEAVFVSVTYLACMQGNASALCRWMTIVCAWPEAEWEHVGTLEVDLCRNWLLFESHVAEVHLDLFCERGPTRPPECFGRVLVPAV